MKTRWYDTFDSEGELSERLGGLAVVQGAFLTWGAWEGSEICSLVRLGGFLEAGWVGKEGNLN